MKYAIVDAFVGESTRKRVPKIVQESSTVRLRVGIPTTIIPSVVKEPVKNPEILERGSRFVSVVRSYLLGIGVKAPPSEYWWAPWVLNTRAGELYILVYGNRIICTFNEPVRAAEVLGIRGNRLEDSGAWNFKFGDGPFLEHIKTFRTEMAWLLRRTTANGLAMVVLPVEPASSVSSPETPAAKAIRRQTVMGVPAPAGTTLHKSGPVVVPSSGVE